MESFSLQTRNRTEMVNITDSVRRAITASGVSSGICIVFCPHTTAGITINENADPDVPRDIQMELNKRIPFEDGYFHGEGNSAAHIKTLLTGSSETLIVDRGQPVLGTWQGIYFCEYDGSRRRTVHVKVIGDR